MKIRAVFLAVLMFFWLFAGTMAFAGGAAAENADGIEYNDADDSAIEVIFQGQDVFAVGTIFDGNEGETVNLRSVESFEGGEVESSSQVEQLAVEELNLGAFSGELGVEIKTDDLDAGTYFIRGLDGLPQRPSEDDTFEAAIQNIATEFDDDTVTDEGPDALTDLDIDSNRGTYTLNVSADGDLNDEELYNIFVDTDDPDNPDFSGATRFGYDDSTDRIDADRSDGIGAFNVILYDNSVDDFEEQIGFIGINDNKREIDFRDIDQDDYDFLFEVTDSTAEDTASINIAREISQSNLTYMFEIPNDGETYSIGIPGGIEGSLADMIGPDIEGYTIFRFDEGDWVAVSDFETTELDALEAIAIATEDGGEQPDTFTLQMEFTSQSSLAAPPQTELGDGWNFVSAPKHGAADTVFGVDDTFLVLDRFEQPSSVDLQDFDSFNNHFIGSDDNTVNPFKGYYVYVEDDTALPGVLSGVETRDDIYTQLDVEKFG